MIQLKHLVVAVDLMPEGDAISPGSRRAVDQALWLAGRVGARLSFVHSTTRDRYLDPLLGEYVIVGHGPTEAGGQALEGLLAEAESAGVTAELLLREEKPWLAVARFAESSGADLVMAGKRSRDERDGRRLGSQSKRLLRKCPVPVWVTSEAHAGEVRTIVAATDFTPVGDRAVWSAGALARILGARLHAVHAVPMEFLPSARYATTEFAARYEEEQSLRMKAARRSLDQVVQGLHGEVEAEAHVLDRPAYDAVRDFAHERGADLVVLGTVSRGGLSGFLLGNTAERLLDGIEASLLAIKPEDWAGQLPAD